MKISKDTKIRAMKVALERAKKWFENFGVAEYNAYSADDFQTHEILEDIKYALEISEKEEK